MAGIALEGVSKVYDGSVRAVDGVDLEISDGEFVVLVGPSGCGKSTLLRMIAGLEHITEGSVRIGDRDVTHRSPAVELYGSSGTLQLLGDDWAPNGYEVWENAREAWTVHPETNPSWRWTAGLTHLVEAIETDRTPLIRPEHGLHALEVMLAAQAAGRSGSAVEIASDFPAVDYAAWPDAARDRRARHDPGSA